MCYNISEVNDMDEQQQNENPQVEEESGYVPRPKWQVWAARVALVLFLFVLLMYYLNMFRGGL